MTSNPAQGKRRRTKANSWLLAYKEKLGCQICGYKKHPEILVVHHKELVRRNRNKKNLSGSFVSGMTSIKRMKGSLKKCLILLKLLNKLLILKRKSYFERPD